MTTLLQAVEQLSGVETKLSELRGLLLQRQVRGQLSGGDVARFDGLRFALYTAEMECYGKYAIWAQRAAIAAGLEDFAAEIPQPTMMPGLTFRLQGLGVAPVVAAGGLGAWATFLLTVAAVVVVLGAIAIGAALIYSLLSLAEHAETQLAYYRTQESIAQNCLAGGGTPEQCGLLLAANRPPDPPAQPPDTKSLLMVCGAAVLGGLVLVMIGSSQSGGRQDGVVLQVRS